MGAPKPCLGHPSRTVAVHALRTEGLTPPEIAARVGITVKQVYALEASTKRKRGPAVADDHAGRRLPPVAAADILPTDHELRACARRHAARRGYSVERLMRELAEALFRDDIVDAVLDDADLMKAAS